MNPIHHPLRFLVRSAVLVAIVVLSVLAMNLPAVGQVTATTTTTLSLVPPTVAATTTTSSNSAAITLPQNRPIALIPEFAMMTAAGTNNVTFTLQVSADGTNYTTSSGLTHTVAGNGTTTVRSYWLLPTTSLAAVRFARISSYNNSANSSILTNLAVTVSKAAGP